MKYYVISKIIALIVLLGLLAIPVSAYTLDSSGAHPDKIFKCQLATVIANFSDYGSITSVTAIFINERIMSQGLSVYNTSSIAMTDSGSGVWSTTFGGNPTMYWGERTILLSVNDGSAIATNKTILVYSDTFTECSGTITSYQNVNSGLGKYNSMLYDGTFTFFGTSLETSFIGWTLYPWVEVWGYVFYVLVIFAICSTIYLKTQNIVQPLVIGVFLLLVFVPMSVVDEIYRQWIIFIVALAITALYYRIFVRD